MNPDLAKNHLSSLYTVLKGMRGVGFFGGATLVDFIKLDESGLKYIIIGVNEAYVFYNKGYEKQAERLAVIAKKNNGFLPVKNPDETREIGLLLGYDPQAVDEFVKKHFPMNENIKKKLIITESQYNRVLTTLSNKKPLVLTEGRKEVILGISNILMMSLGKSLSNYNKIIGDKLMANKEAMTSIKTVFEDADKLNELLGELEEVGMKNPELRLSSNAQKIVDTYNKVATDNNLDLHMDVDVINNLKDLK
jgi:hypothetical protein